MNKEYQEGYKDGFTKAIASAHPEYNAIQWSEYKYGYEVGFKHRKEIEAIQSSCTIKY